jgi:hypothetical protein
MSISDINATDEFDNSLVGIMGGSTNTRIGNVVDRLKVNSAIAPFSAANSFFLDLNAGVGGLARDANVAATFTNLYNYAGSGTFLGFLVTLETAKDFWVRVVVDDIYFPFFGSDGLSLNDVDNNSLYDISGLSEQGSDAFNMSYNQNTFCWTCSCGIDFASRIQLQARRGNNTRKFRAGFVRVVYS